MMTRWIRRATPRRLALGPLMALACNVALDARAEVRIEGTTTALHVSTTHDAVAEVLAALGTQFAVKYRSAIPLDAAAADAYAGSIRQVIAHLLDGYDYVIKGDQQSVEIVVFGKHADAAIAPPPAPPANAAKGIVSRWR